MQRGRELGSRRIKTLNGSILTKLYKRAVL
jgi:hypothetical protein